MLQKVAISENVIHWDNLRAQRGMEENVMYCSKCGNKVEEGRRECPYCGSSLVSAEAKSAGTPVQSTGAENQSVAGIVQPAGAAETIPEAAAASSQNGTPALLCQQEHLPQSQQELKEYLTQLAQAEAAPVSASAVNAMRFAVPSA